MIRDDDHSIQRLGPPSILYSTIVIDDRFQYSIRDMLAFMLSMTCFVAMARHVGLISILMLPGFLIAPSVLMSQANSRRTKLWYTFLLLIVALLLFHSTK